MAPVKKKKAASSHDPYTQSSGETSDSSKPRVANGVKGGGAPKMAAPKRSSSSASSSRDKVIKKSSKRPPSKKQNRKGDNRDGGTSPPPAAAKRRKPKPESATSRASYAGTDDDSSDEDDGAAPKENSRLPVIGDEIAIKCPPDPQYPEGWYSCLVIGIVVHDENGYEMTNSKAGPQSNDVAKNFTLHVEWDGGGEATLQNPEWRMKGDAPDKQGRVSHRDAKLRPYFKYWVNRLNSMGESEKKLSRTRAGKNTRVDPGQKFEWIRCSNPSCGKWRPVPTYMKSSAILESCDSKWFCVLNSWDEAIASCGAPQETGYMPTK